MHPQLYNIGMSPFSEPSRHEIIRVGGRFLRHENRPGLGLALIIIALIVGAILHELGVF
jgi:hypothetical protein